MDRLVRPMPAGGAGVLPGAFAPASPAASDAPGAPPVMKVLPPLREDLRLIAAAPNRDGSPAWMIHDPVGNRFFRIGWLEFEFLSRWSLHEPSRVLDAVREDTSLAPEAEDLQALVAFLRQHQLLRASDPGGVAMLAEIARRARGSRWKWLLHNYLFFRIPLVHPDRFLGWLAPRTGFLFTRTFAFAVLGCALLGLALAARQWDAFVHTFQDFLSPAGLAGYAVALVLAKTLHELGHAVTATRAGVRVAHMGVAFLVLWPMLYTDTGESWKLTDRRARFRIAAAGIAVEFALAAFATLAWSLVDDGALRSAAFFLATTSWIITLGINASPFMRFDGYFLLSDTLDLPNLHQRSFELTRAWLRRGLLGWDEPDPEVFDPALRRGLIAFALVTWLYRLIVFAGIALAVYLMFFKVLGIFLFAVEVAWFIVRPFWSEFSIWWQGRARIRPLRGLLVLLLAGAIIAPLVLPWSRSVRGEAWLHAEQQTTIYSPFPARIVSVREAGMVAAGATLVTLDSPDTRGKSAQTRALADALSLELDQLVGRRDGIQRQAIVAEQLGQQLAELGAQQAELKRLALAAPFAGRLLDLDPAIRPGVWVNGNHPIGVLIDPDRWVVDVLVEQQALSRITVGSPARFHVRGRPEAALEGEVIAIDSARAPVLPHPMFAAEHGGRVAAIKQPNGSLAPRDALYRVRLRVASPPNAAITPEIALGTAVIDGDRRSLIVDWLTAVGAVLVRESGF